MWTRLVYKISIAAIKRNNCACLANYDSDSTFYNQLLMRYFSKKDRIIKVKTFVWWEDPTPGRGEWSYISMENGGMFHIMVVDTKALFM